MYSIKSEEMMSHAFRRSVYKNGGELKPNDLSSPWGGEEKKKTCFQIIKECVLQFITFVLRLFFHSVYCLNNAFAP